MKILFVLECANQPTNGTTASCIRFAKELEKKGHEVSIIGCERIVGEAYFYGQAQFLPWRVDRCTPAPCAWGKAASYSFWNTGAYTPATFRPFCFWFSGAFVSTLHRELAT